MKNRKLYYFSYIFLCLIFACRLISAQTSTPVESNSENTANQATVSEENLIHQGDLIDVDVAGSTEFDWRGTLTPEGFLSLVNYSENPIYGLCRTEDAVAVEVAKSLSKILRAPQVVVKILDRSNRPVSVIYGAIKTPQRFQIKRPVFLNELIIDSGGFTDKVSGEIQILRSKNLNCLSKTATKNENSNNSEQQANEKYIKVTESGDTQYLSVKISDLISGKKEANPQILSGDIITVLEAGTVYVIGGVVNPKQVAFRSQMTLVRAIDSAGGLKKDALPENVSIFRRENKSTKIIEANLTKAKANPADDIILQAADIVDVGQRGRDKRKYPPIIRNDEPNVKSTAELPLRIID